MTKLRFQILEPEICSDGKGGQVYHWVSRGFLWAEPTGEQTTSSQSLWKHPSTTLKVTLRNATNLKPGWRARLGDTLYTIKALERKHWINPDQNAVLEVSDES